MQIIPLALGQSDGAITLWDENAELAIVFPRPIQFISDIAWGLGHLDDQPCLILYLFIGDQAVELYFPEQLPTSPEHQVDTWQTLFNWQPEVIKVRYGESPVDKNHEVMLLFPKEEGETLMEKLTAFILQAKQTLDSDHDEIHGQIVEKLSSLLREVAT